MIRQMISHYVSLSRRSRSGAQRPSTTDLRCDPTARRASGLSTQPTPLQPPCTTRRRPLRGVWPALLTVLYAAGCADLPSPLAGGEYVAMGSSFAAGPGVGVYEEASPAPCFRSGQNYARQLAARLGMRLRDVSCSGATTAHLTGPRDSLPPQLDALGADTRLVTVTIGGNDLGYIGRLTAGSCIGLATETGGSAADCRPLPPVPGEDVYGALASRMEIIAREVRRRAPAARLVFVDYLSVLPETGQCAGTPLPAGQADEDRRIARRLASITERVAAENQADLLKASVLSLGRDACSPEPWMHGYPRPEIPVNGAPYHPTLAGMTAIADALEGMLRSSVSRPPG